VHLVSCAKPGCLSACSCCDDTGGDSAEVHAIRRMRMMKTCATASLCIHCSSDRLMSYQTRRRRFLGTAALEAAMYHRPACCNSGPALHGRSTHGSRHDTAARGTQSNAGWSTRALAALHCRRHTDASSGVAGWGELSRAQALSRLALRRRCTHYNTDHVAAQRFRSVRCLQYRMACLCVSGSRRARRRNCHVHLLTSVTWDDV